MSQLPDNLPRASQIILKPATICFFLVSAAYLVTHLTGKVIINLACSIYVVYCAAVRHLCLLHRTVLPQANFFLENVLATLAEPVDGRLVAHLLSDPLCDGGQFDMIVSLVAKCVRTARCICFTGLLSCCLARM